MIARPKDFCMAVVLLALAGFLYDDITSMNLGAVHALGPAFFPKVLLYCIGGLSFVLLLQSLNLRKSKAPAGAAASCPADDDDEPVGKGAIIMQGAFTLLLLAYLFALPRVGYIWATMTFLFAGMLMLGPRKVKPCIIYIVVSAAVTFGLRFVFSTLLHLFLP